ncbi:MAG: hypothetical protein CME64_00425 [Halobacteriovoraceae bacterium]|nr:hypothetical protein [Halobacteriovoraceae bacterium]|tara:strand:+ start:106468 stop:107094 length:627 start_codon:yes stop_codon:yes gene_type:complete
MSKLNIMRPIDKAIFSKIEELQSVKEVQKILDAYSNLDEKPQEIVKIALAAVLFIIPAVIIFIFIGLNSSLKSELETKQDLLSLSQNIVQQKAGLKTVKRDILGRVFISNMGDMQGLISGAANASGVDSSKISVSKFQAQEHEGFITQATMDMRFTGLSNAEFFGLVNTLNSRQKVRFDEISVNKNSSSNLLEGVATIHYYSQDESGL